MSYTVFCLSRAIIEFLLFIRFSFFVAFRLFNKSGSFNREKIHPDWRNTNIQRLWLNSSVIMKTKASSYLSGSVICQGYHHHLQTFYFEYSCESLNPRYVFHFPNISMNFPLYNWIWRVACILLLYELGYCTFYVNIETINLWLLSNEQWVCTIFMKC